MIENKKEILTGGNKEARKICIDLIEHALESINPSKEIRKNVSFTGSQLSLFGKTLNLRDIKNIYVLGAGKASYTMAREIETILPNGIKGGTVVTKYGYKEKPLKTRVLEAGHPVPDENSQKAGKEILRTAYEATDQDLVINLISGGGSALLCAPAEPVSLKEMQKTTDFLVASGATINEINAVRKHLSRVKGGKLAKAIHPARCVSLIVSDVVGDPLDVIASGPTVPDPSTFDDAYSVLNKYSLLDKVSKSVKGYISNSRNEKAGETPKENEFDNINVDNIIISNNDMATEAVAGRGKELGFSPLILSRMIEGESKEAGLFFAGILKDVVRTETPLAPPALIVSGGETTVTLDNQGGKGGPNQEFALGAASKISGLSNVAVAAIDTDGTDGPTDVAGGIVDGTTTQRLTRKGLNLAENLSSHNSKVALEKINDAIRTGPTGTNVNDLRIGIVL